MRHWFILIICWLVCCELTAQPYDTQTPADAKYLHDRALELHEIDQDEEAYSLTIKALSVLDSFDLNETPLYAECLHDAGMFAMLGEKDLDTFIFYMQRAISLKNELYGNDDDYYWSVQCYADGLLLYSDDLSFPNNITTLEDAVKAYEEIPFYQTLPSYYRALNNLSQMYADIDISKSIENGEKLIQLIRENHIDCDSIIYISNLGNYYKEDEQYDKAFYYLNNALSAREESGVIDNGLKISYERMASLCARIGHFDKACDYIEKAKTIEESLNGKDTYSYATIIMNYGAYLYANNNYQSGLKYLREAYSHPKCHKGNVASNLAAVFSGINEPDSCYYYIKDSWDFYKKDLNKDFLNMSEENRFHYFSNGQTYYSLHAPMNYLRNYKNHNGLIRLAYECVLFHKDALFNNLKGETIQSSETHLEKIFESLCDNEVAIEMLYDPLFEEEDIIYVFIAKRNWDHPKFVQLDAGAIKKALRGEMPADSLGTYLPLYETIWKDILSVAEIEDNDRIYISCDGVLSNIPIEWICNYDFDYMGDIYDIVRVTTTKDIPRQKNEKKVNSVALYGGLNYDKKPKEIINNQTGFRDCSIWPYLSEVLGDSIVNSYRSSVNYLPWSLIEVDSIYIILTDYLNPDNIKLLDSDSGTEQAFKSMSGCSPSIIHIATHGFFLTAQEYMNWYDYYNYCMENSGVLLSGSLFSIDGANNGLLDDGILRSSEIAELNLRSTDLVILSACKTGLTGYTPYGLLGLQRAFKVAGVRTIIMSLENVDDAATCFLMTSFYRNLMKGMSKREAFKEAQWSLRTDEKFKNFNYWAWFVMID